MSYNRTVHLQINAYHIDLMQILHKLNFINQRNEPHHEKEHVKISNAAKFQSCRPNTREMVDI